MSLRGRDLRELEFAIGRLQDFLLLRINHERQTSFVQCLNAIYGQRKRAALISVVVAEHHRSGYNIPTVRQPGGKLGSLPILLRKNDRRDQPEDLHGVAILVIIIDINSGRSDVRFGQINFLTANNHRAVKRNVLAFLDST
ncbi:hypothetical protein D3C71_1708020 [compost metagenome]